jgi:hypothetical protein
MGGPLLDIFSGVNMVLEMTLFVAAMAVMYRTGDWKVFLKADLSNLVLIIPITTVLLPSTVGYPFSEPLLLTSPTLAIAHIVFLALFCVAVFKTFSHILHGRTSHKPLQTAN